MQNWKWSNKDNCLSEVLKIGGRSKVASPSCFNALKAGDEINFVRIAVKTQRLRRLIEFVSFARCADDVGCARRHIVKPIITERRSHRRFDAAVNIGQSDYHIADAAPVGG